MRAVYRLVKIPDLRTTPVPPSKKKKKGRRSKRRTSGTNHLNALRLIKTHPLRQMMGLALWQKTVPLGRRAYATVQSDFGSVTSKEVFAAELRLASMPPIIG